MSPNAMLRRNLIKENNGDNAFGFRRIMPILQFERFGNYRVFQFEVSISAPRLDLGSKSQQNLTLARSRSIWDFRSLGAKAQAMLADFLTY
jgi:hypothetical protein